MSLENPLFGSREGREEVLSEVSKAEKQPNVSDAPSEIEINKPGEVEPTNRRSGSGSGLKRGETFKVSEVPSEEPKRRIGFAPFEGDEPNQVQNETSYETATERAQKEAVPVPPLETSEKSGSSRLFEHFDEDPRQSFEELVADANREYGELATSIEQTVESVKQKGRALADKVARKTGISMAYRGVLSGAEKLTKTAFFVRNVNNYGWRRFMKEGIQDAAKAAGRAVVRKGVMTILNNTQARETVMAEALSGVEAESEKIQKYREQLAAAHRQLEDLKARGVISNFTPKIPPDLASIE